MDAGGYTGQGRGADWVQKVLGWTTEIVCHPPKLAPDEVMRRWVTEWAQEGMSIDPEKLSRPRRFWGSASAMGGRAHILLVGPKQADELGLRKAG
jgi:hypothetical protein